MSETALVRFALLVCLLLAGSLGLHLSRPRRAPCRAAGAAGHSPRARSYTRLREPTATPNLRRRRGRWPPAADG